MRRAACIAALWGAVLAGCGGSTQHPKVTARHESPAVQVCGSARRAAASALRAGVDLRIKQSDPLLIECVVSAPSIRLDVVAQASPRAWDQYDTTVVHQAQAFGPGSVADRAALPQHVQGMTGNAAWIPTQSMLVTTNGTPSQGGSYLTVTVTRATRRAERIPVARAVARAVLPVAPRGGSPGPAPS